ncbi:MAG: chemotaxis protein CheW [Nitrosomonadales bacterium]|nr:chemotaxis protein CheW [Nitrosomonadales bacterium]
MSIDLTQFYQIFFEEAAEHLATMETLLLELDVSNPSMDDLNAIFRSAHSIKGGAGTFGFTDMTEVTHVLETLLDRLRKQEMTLTDEMVTAFLEAGDVIAMQLAAHRDEGSVDEAEVKAVCERLAYLTEGKAAPSPITPSAAVAKTDAEEDAYGFFDDLFDATKSAAEAAAQSAGEAYGFFDEVPPPAPATQQAEESGYGFFEETPVQKSEREEKQGYGFFQEPQPVNQAAPAAPSATPAPASSEAARIADTGSAPAAKRPAEKAATAASAETSIRVSVEKVDQLINLAGELVITQAMLAQAALDSGEERLQRGLYQLERNTRDLQEAVMSIRMMPISFVFSRFPRVVRDLAGKLNKQVELKTVGESTELDKGLIEKIADPLTHLIRNSLDHGIESPEKRMAAGKDARGTITLKAYHQGGNVVIEVTDDGGGLNKARILNKARERGLSLRDDMTDQDVYALIMEAGFSTAEVVTDVSGRGVGMDVVKRNITELGGRLELDSVEGFGTRTIIRLPLTLAILDGLSVSVGHEVYIIPLNAIIESLQVTVADLKTVSGEGRLLRVRGEYLPLVALHEIFNTRPVAEGLEKGIVVIVEAEGRKTALFVDELLGQHQVVIKSLESNFRKIQGISGATIMGDGKVALILDVAALVAYHGQNAKAVV